MMRPMRTEIETAAMIRQPQLQPQDPGRQNDGQEVYGGACEEEGRGGTYAGAPAVLIPANIGKIVQLQTARMVPEVGGDGVAEPLGASFRSTRPPPLKEGG